MVKLGRGTLPHAGSPSVLAAGQCGQEHHRVGCGLGVVPELGRSQDLVVVAEDDEPVLLGGDRNGDRAVPVGDPGLGTRGGERNLPGVWVLFAAGRRRGRVLGTAGRDDRTGVGVADLHFARGGGRVHPDHEGH